MKQRLTNLMSAAFVATAMSAVAVAVAVTVVVTVAVPANAQSMGVPAAGGAAEQMAKGTFEGANDHITTGGVSIERTSDGETLVVLASDFSLDGAPDPRVGFGKDGAYVDASDLGPLTRINGRQVYKVPAGVDVDEFNEVYIWCRKFSVSLGVAAIE